ncbi:MAG: hypothetical protein NXI04_29090 [Planctomycetaceae bacterium]|nr:hypothetical protein [Planctomycetaceae bacterium]
MPEATDDISAIDPNLWGEKVGTHHPAENLTWGQFREALRRGHQLEPPEDVPCIPFTSYFQRHAGFGGFHTISSLSSHIIRKHKLTLDGFNVLTEAQEVAVFQAWQEGYSDEDYNDEPLSFGVRLRGHTDFINEVCGVMNRAFAIQTIENRYVMKDYEHQPEKSTSRVTYRIWPIR